MHELLTQILGYVRGMWRYRWYAMLVAWLLAPVGWLYVAGMPDQYKADARVYVDTQSVLRPLMRGLAVQPSVSQRLDMLERTLLSRPHLEKVARMSDLDLSAQDRGEMDRLLNGLKSDINLRTSRGTNLYNISYTHHEPEQAKQVVQSLVTLFVEEGLAESRQQTGQAQRFLDQQIKEYEKRLQEAEQRLSDFERKHVGIMPGEGGNYYQRLRSAREQLEQARLDLKEARERRAELQRRLQNPEEALQSGVGQTQAQDAIDARIDELQQKLDDLLIKFTEKHPDVVATRRTIEKLREQKEEASQAAQKGQDERAVSAMQQQIKVALSEADAGVAAMKTRVKEYQRRVDELIERVDTIPQVETRLKQLNRDYRVVQNKYQSLLERRETARLSEEIKDTGSDVQFRVVDPPRVPASPSAPNRPLLMGGVLFLSLGAGGGVAFLMSQLRPVFDTRRSLQEALAVPVFGSVSLIWTRGMVLRRRIEVATFVTIGLALVGAFAVVLAKAEQLGEVRRLLQAATGWI